MALPKYPYEAPSLLPLPSVVDSYAISPQENLQRTEMENGPALQRSKTDSPIYEISFAFNFTDAENLLFESWYKHILNNGVDWFLIPLAVGDELREQEARFSSSYQSAMSGAGLWKITASLEIRQRELYSKDEMVILEQYDQPSLVRDANDFAILINEDFKTLKVS